MDQVAANTHQGDPLARTSIVPWSQAFLACLPHLLYPVAVYGYHLTGWQPYRTGNGYQVHLSTLLFWLLLGAGLVYAALTGWPRWSATWVGYGLVGAAELLLVLPTSGIDISEPLAITSGIAWFALILAVLAWTARRDALDGLLAVLPVMPMWYASLALDGVIGNEAPLFYIDGMLIALVVAWVVRRGERRAGLIAIVAVVAAVCLPLAYATVYLSNADPVLGTNAAPQASGVIWAFITFLLGFVCFSVPVWLTALIRWRKSAAG